MNLWLISKINICRIKIYSKCFKGHSFCAENFGAFFMNVMRGRQSSYYNFFKWSEKYFKLTLYKGRQITSINPTCICGNSSFRSRSIIAWKYKHRDNKLLFSAASIIPPLLHTHSFTYHWQNIIWETDNAIHVHSAPPFPSNLCPLTPYILNCITN